MSGLVKSSWKRLSQLGTGQVENFLGQTTFLSPKLFFTLYFGTHNFFGLQNFLDPKYFGAKQFFSNKNSFEPKIVFRKLFSIQMFFGPNIFCDPFQSYKVLKYIIHLFCCVLVKNIVTTPTQPQLKSKVRFDMKMTLHNHHHYHPPPPPPPTCHPKYFRT